MRDDDHVILAIPKGRVHATCIHVWNRGASDIEENEKENEWRAAELRAIVDKELNDGPLLRRLKGPAGEESES